ncbi:MULTISPECIES: catalase [unclassified Arthrobacter]|uniref:catalase n=1 Tax=unclassified Arthrobacter TaxID=235627 RepID=UPI0021072680|nr:MULTISPECIES: catalase [unclassified Arthrobacter]MCQ1945683.1 catalase [Arthrobacter sp. zg-Y1116]MCQ1985625.1 catalase [Arthrobacter sp. zg-Y844]MCQ1994658.1 catalase [Arthrobacter sp. zg-Y1171]UWX81265.1 catalase [Arthrobacter sp. zg-Y1171]
MSNFTTTQTGTPVASDAHSLSTGADGAIALHDRYLVEKLAQFNRERIPERIVHAKGGGAFGEFVVTEDVSKYTRAAVFQPGTVTETVQRFSSVAGEMGSPDTWRDVRGFALRFYSSEGNYDIVGNNTPVFFIRDGIKFPDFIHSQKRLPGSGLRDADMQWDFWTNSPESAHQVTYLMGDRGLPTSWREMPGFGSHTYQWINAAGERFWVKYHFTSNQGNHEITGAEAEKIAGADADYYRRDLYEAIEAGNFPSWDLHVQVMPYEDAKTYRFNPFDLTKVWPHADYPLIKVGTHTLNRNPENFFAQIEQVALSPANLVPGIDASPDKMLMARIFSYPDAQRYRIGANYNQLPVNAPKAPVNNYSQDGAMRFSYNSPQTPVYAPNTLGGPAADAALAGSGSWENDGALVRAAATLHSEDSDFVQAGTLYREVYDDAAKQRFLETITGAISGVKRPHIREAAIQYWTNVDATLGEKLRLSLAQGETTANEKAEFVGVAE